MSRQHQGSLLFGAPYDMGVPRSQTTAEGFAQALPSGEGLTAHLAELPGPFAFAHTNPETSETVLARDRLGRNRLFYHVGPNGTRWSKDLIQLARDVSPEGLSAEGVRELLAFRWNMGRGTPLHGIKQVQPGTVVRIDAHGNEMPEYFWNLAFDPQEPTEPLEHWVDQTEEAMRSGLTKLLEGAQKPFVLLSGGVDSALEAAVGAKIRPDLVAITPEWARNPSPELPRAKAVAEHLGLEHRVMYMEDEDLLRFVPECIRYFGGPIRDYHMVMLAWVYDSLGPEGFDLVLHGQAADTLFGAGNIGFAEKFGEKRKWLEFLPTWFLEGLADRMPDTMDFGDRFERLLSMDKETAILRRHRLMHRKALRQDVPEWLAFRNPRSGILERVPGEASQPVRIQIADFYQGSISHMVTSTAISSPHGITMAYPFLTPEILDVGARLPDAYKNRGGETKPVLKDLGARFFPADWMKAPKLGFPTPTIEWLARPLAPWIEERLGPESLSRELLGHDLVAGLSLPDDYELLWTLSHLEELLSLTFPGARPKEIPVLEP